MTANNLLDAQQIAEVTFAREQDKNWRDIEDEGHNNVQWGHAISRVRDESIIVVRTE